MSQPATDWFTKPLHGMEAVEAQLAGALDRERLPSAYLLSGAEGIGKATLACRLAASLLAPAEAASADGGLFGDTLPAAPSSTLSVDPDASALTRMLQSSHPDFLWIRPPYDEKKKAYKKDIPIERVRAIGEFMSLTAGEMGWKIVVVDPAEAMNHNAANALLKWLEEPPARSLFILVSHVPGKLLPTIRSRCREITMPGLSHDAFNAVVDGHMDATSATQLYALTNGSPGMALHWQETKALDYWWQLLDALIAPNDTHALLKLAETIGKDEHMTLAHVQRLVDMLVRQVAAYQATGEMQTDDATIRSVLEKLAQRRPLPAWLELWETQRQSVETASILYLDKRQVITNLLMMMTGIRG